MNSRDLVQFACQLSLEGHRLVDLCSPFARSGIEQYWAASKCRLDRWSRELKQAQNRQQPFWPVHDCESFRRTAVEILTGEILTRLWTAISSAHDRYISASEAEPIARSVLIAHLDARRRVLGLLAHHPNVLDPEVAALNGVRRQSERAADLLVAHLGCHYDVWQTAFHPESARRLASTVSGPASQYDRSRWRLLIQTLAFDWPAAADDAGPNADLNQAIAGGILNCFAPGLFNGSGELLSSNAAAISAMHLDQRPANRRVFGEGPHVPPESAPRAVDFSRLRYER